MATRRRPKKKPSNNGIWVGSGISCGIVLLIAIALFFKFQPGPADRASGAITDENLAKQTLKTEGLPELGDAPGGSSSLDDLLIEAKKIQNFITAGGIEDQEKAEKAKPVIQALHGAAASEMGKGLLDQQIPVKYFDSPEMKSNFAAVGRAISITIKSHSDQIEFDEAQAIAISYLKLGQKIYENNTRLKSRQRGLAIMKSALRKLGEINKTRYEDGEIEQDELRARNDKVMKWNNAIKAVEDVWNSKLEPTESVNQKKGKPNIGDLIRVAKEDQDVTFRAWAALRLGYALFERGEAGNQKAIKAAIEELKSDSVKLVADAAAAGESIKDSDEYYELRK
ncbi:MAG: hypothetical protein KTR15_06055 [Phycisphaeraceae bacterium]|nr:hypothetical protein [Phycisphaeraceae bacterium]